VRRVDPSTKVIDFCDRFHDLVDEMQYREALSPKNNPILNMLARDPNSIKTYCFYSVVALNFIILLDARAEHPTVRADRESLYFGVGQPNHSVADHLVHRIQDLQMKHVLEVLMFCFGVLQLIGSIIIATSFVAANAVLIINQAWRKRVAEVALRRKAQEKSMLQNELDGDPYSIFSWLETRDMLSEEIQYLLEHGGVEWNKRYLKKEVALSIRAKAAEDNEEADVMERTTSAWFVYWVISIWYLFEDAKFLYQFLYIIFSLLGMFWNSFFYSWHMLDVAYRWTTLQALGEAIAKQYRQVGVTFLFTAIVMYIFGVIGFANFRRGIISGMHWRRTRMPPTDRVSSSATACSTASWCRSCTALVREEEFARR